jgi:hypothetical protein
MHVPRPSIGKFRISNAIETQKLHDLSQTPSKISTTARSCASYCCYRHARRTTTAFDAPEHARSLTKSQIRCTDSRGSCTMVGWDVVSGRLVPYWIAVACSLWILAFLYAWTCDPGFNAYFYGMFVPVRSMPSQIRLLGWRSYTSSGTCADAEPIGSRGCGLVLDSHRTRRSTCLRKLHLFLVLDDAQVTGVALQLAQQDCGSSPAASGSD